MHMYTHVIRRLLADGVASDELLLPFRTDALAASDAAGAAEQPHVPLLAPLVFDAVEFGGFRHARPPLELPAEFEVRVPSDAGRPFPVCVCVCVRVCVPFVVWSLCARPPLCFCVPVRVWVCGGCRA